MGLKNMSLLADGATIAATGGTPITLAEDGVTIQNGLHLIVTEDTNYETRRQVTVKNRPPVLDPKTGTYGKDKKSISLALPYIVGGTNKVVFNTIRIEREMHPAVSSETALDLNKLGAQLLIDADVASFWATGSLS